MNIPCKGVAARGVCRALNIFTIPIFAAIFTIAGIIACLFPSAVYAAQPDTLRADLQEIYIEASRLPIRWKNQPVQVSLVDSAAAASTAAMSLGDALRFNSPIIIRPYGLGGIQSVSGRGFGARQTQLMWNGFSINHSMLGEVDYNLIPSAMAENIRVVAGNSSASFGDGGAAGTVLFDSPAARNQTSVEYQQGAWGQQQMQLQSGYSGQRLRFGLMLTGRQATNNYPYFDEIRGREETRRNNQFSSRQAMLTGGYSGGNLKYDTSLWLGANQSHISGSSTVRNPQAVQDDAFVRWSNQLSLQRQAGLWQLSSFYEAYELNYTDQPSSIESLSEVTRHNYRLTYRFAPMEGLFVSSGVDAGFTTVETNNFSGIQTRQQYSLYMHAEYRPLDELLIYPATRLITYSDFGEQLTGSLGLNYQTPVSWLSLRGQVSANYNPPSLNDLYWSTGGNPDLKPERSTTVEGGLAAEQPLKNGLLRLGLSAFRISFENGIRWLPGSGGVWSPVNLFEIDSRGLEGDTSLKYRINNWNLNTGLALAYTKATSPRTETSEGQQLTVNRQLTYVPKWSWKATAGLGYDPVFIRAAWQQTGSRFSTSDHSSPNDPLDAFTDLTLQAGLRLALAGVSGQLSYTLHNVQNQQYEFISRYPMPPRYHTLAVKLQFGY